MSSNSPFVPGHRVCIDGLEQGRGTVIGWPEDLMEVYTAYYSDGYVPLCADERSTQSPDYCVEIDRWCGYGQGRLVASSRLAFTGNPVYHKISPHIGVCVPPDGLIIKGVKDGVPDEKLITTLPGGLTGRVMRYKAAEASGHRYEIGWHKSALTRYGIVGEKHLFHKAKAGNETSDYATWEEPEALVWCRLDPADCTIIELWPRDTGSREELEEFNVGDYALYEGGRPVSTVVVDTCRYTIMPGDLVKIVAKDSRRKTAQVELPSWVGERYHSGCKFVVNLNHLRPFKHELIHSGTEVDIVADVDFGGHSLKGRRGVVVLPTDPDGDIGIEFADNIRGAGSLDGRGKSGHCLYVPVSAVKAGGSG